jgi:AcrR family transcriptional regulator
VSKYAKKRRRLRGEEAKSRILDAAEKRLRDGGPGAIRLQDVAADVGVSHPAVLHHFGSREALVQAVVARAIGALEADLVATYQSTDGGPPDAAAMLDRVADTLSEKGHGRLLAWLLLSGYGDALDTESARANWKTIIDAMHGLRVAFGATAPYEDTAFSTALAALALFGQAITGTEVFRLAGVEGKDTPKRFRAWLGSLLVAHLAR